MHDIIGTLATIVFFCLGYIIGNLGKAMTYYDQGYQQGLIEGKVMQQSNKW